MPKDLASAVGSGVKAIGRGFKRAFGGGSKSSKGPGGGGSAPDNTITPPAGDWQAPRTALAETAPLKSYQHVAQWDPTLAKAAVSPDRPTARAATPKAAVSTSATFRAAEPGETEPSKPLAKGATPSYFKSASAMPAAARYARMPTAGERAAMKAESIGPGRSRSSTIATEQRRYASRGRSVSRGRS